MAPRLRKIVGGPIADTLRAIAIEHPDWGPMQVYREIDKRTADEDKAAMPSVRTVQRFLAEFNRPDESGPWTLVDADPDDALLVLPVIRRPSDEGVRRYPLRGRPEHIRDPRGGAGVPCGGGAPALGGGARSPEPRVRPRVGSPGTATVTVGLRAGMGGVRGR